MSGPRAFAGRAARALLRAPALAGVGLVRLYQLVVSPLLPGGCRFYPTCSAYAAEAIARHGLVRGVALGAWRLLRCHPFHPGGYDPVH